MDTFRFAIGTPVVQVIAKSRKGIVIPPFDWHLSDGDIYFEEPPVGSVPVKWDDGTMSWPPGIYLVVDESVDREKIYDAGGFPGMNPGAYVPSTPVIQSVYLISFNNLSDVSNKPLSRQNLGLGNSAVLDLGTTIGSVAEGLHYHTYASLLDLPTSLEQFAPSLYGQVQVQSGGSLDFLLGSSIQSDGVTSIDPFNHNLAGSWKLNDALLTDTFIPATEIGAPNGVAALGNDGKLPFTMLPAFVVTNTFVVSSEAAQLALAAAQGDVVVRTDVSRSFILAAEPASVLGNWVEILSPTSGSVVSVAGKIGVVTLDIADIAGLSAALAGKLAVANNLSEVDPSSARANLGLGNAATKNVGTTAGTVAAGDHTHTGTYVLVGDYTNFDARYAALNHNHNALYQPLGSSLLIANNLSDIVDKAAARTNLGINTNLFFAISNNLSEISDKAAARANLGVDVSNFLAKTNNLSEISAAGPVAQAAARTNLGGVLIGTNNLSDIANAATARINLGVDTSQFLAKASNLSDVANAAVARANLGLATAMLGANNLSELTNPTTARTNLGLGNSAVLNVGTVAGTVSAGDHLHTGVYSPVGHTHADSEAYSGHIETPTAKKYYIIAHATRSETFGSFYGICDSGSVTLIIKRNRGGVVVNLTNSATFSTGSSATLTGTTDIVANDVIYMELSGVSTPAEFRWTMGSTFTVS